MDATKVALRVSKRVERLEMMKVEKMAAKRVERTDLQKDMK